MDRLECLARILVGLAPFPSSTDSEGWRTLVALARAEGVSPLLSQAMRALSSEEIPAEANTLLSSDYREAVLISLRQEAARVALCQCLNERSIPTLLFKGAALAWTCYDDAATRPMGDLDLLVPAVRVEAAARCLEENGFHPYSGSLAAERRSPRGHLIYLHPSTGVPVEVHWQLKLLGRAEKQASAQIWTGARPSAVEGQPLVMRPGHTLPLLCAHMLLQHREPRLIWLYDLHRVLLTLDSAEAELAREAADRWQLGPCTALAVMRAHELFGTALPAALHVWAGVKASHKGLQARVAAHALEHSASEAPSEYLVSLLMNRNFSLLRILFPTPEDLRARLQIPPGQRVGLGAYATFLARRLGNGPLHLRQLWQFWQAGSHSHRKSGALILPESAPRPGQE